MKVSTGLSIDLCNRNTCRLVLSSRILEANSGTDLLARALSASHMGTVCPQIRGKHLYEV
jgi:hypothetical protein